MRAKNIEEIFARENKTPDDVKFFVDYMESICKEFKIHFYGYTNEMYIKVCIFTLHSAT